MYLFCFFLVLRVEMLLYSLSAVELLEADLTRERLPGGGEQGGNHALKEFFFMVNCFLKLIMQIICAT